MAKDKAPKHDASKTGMIHPAQKFFKILSGLLLVAWIFMLLATFTNAWSRNVQSYTQTEYIGLWSICNVNSDHLDSTCCQNPDLDGKPTYSDPKCIGYFVGTRVVSILACIFLGFALLLSFLITIKCVITYPQTKSPITLCYPLIILCILGWLMTLLSWIFWIVFASESCYKYPVVLPTTYTNNDVFSPAPTNAAGRRLMQETPWQSPNTGTDPVGYPWPYPAGQGTQSLEGYSYSWIFAITASIIALLAMFFSCFAMMRLKKFVPQEIIPQEDAVRMLYPEKEVIDYEYARNAYHEVPIADMNDKKDGNMRATGH